MLLHYLVKCKLQAFETGISVQKDVTFGQTMYIILLLLKIGNFTNPVICIQWLNCKMRSGGALGRTMEGSYAPSEAR